MSARMLPAMVLFALAACAPQQPAVSTAPEPATDPRAVQPERPTVATHAGTVAPGFAELETGIERDRFADGTIGVQLPSVMKVGLASNAQLSLQLPLSAPSGGSAGVGDVAVGVKWRVLDNAPLVHDFALLPQVKFSTGGSRGTCTTDASLLLISSRTIGPVALDLNAGITTRSGDGSTVPRTASLWTVSTGWTVKGSFGWVFEGYGYPGTGGPAGAPPVVAVLTGPTLTVNPSLAVDLGIIAPVAGPQPRAIYAGFVANFGRWIGSTR